MQGWNGRVTAIAQTKHWQSSSAVCLDLAAGHWPQTKHEVSAKKVAYEHQQGSPEASLCLSDCCLCHQPQVLYLGSQHPQRPQAVNETWHHGSQAK
jgi:hypothetical protein